MHWQPEALSRPLNEVRHKHSLLMHRMRGVDLHHRRDAVLRALTGFVLKSSEIEGEYLGTVQVRSSVARHLGLDSPMRSTVPAEVEKVVSMMLRATDSFLEKLTEGQLFEWHSDLFYGESVSKAKIAVGAWRNDSLGRMEVVSGPVGKFKVHYVAPKACTIGKEVRAFLDWFNTPQNTDLVLKAGLAHLWFVLIHPFDDGNGRIARAISERILTQWDHVYGNSQDRFYNMAEQIRIERKDYYNHLEKAGKGTKPKPR